MLERLVEKQEKRDAEAKEAAEEAAATLMATKAEKKKEKERKRKQKEEAAAAEALATTATDAGMGTDATVLPTEATATSTNATKPPAACTALAVLPTEAAATSTNATKPPAEANDRAATPRRVSFKRSDASFYEPATPKATADQAKVAPEEPNPKKRGVVEEPVPESRPCKTPRGLNIPVPRLERAISSDRQPDGPEETQDSGWPFGFTCKKTNKKTGGKS